jgi:hypothetical protein
LCHTLDAYLREKHPFFKFVKVWEEKSAASCKLQAKSEYKPETGNWKQVTGNW